MKNFLEEYGMAILAIIILITIFSGVYKLETTINFSLQSQINKFSYLTEDFNKIKIPQNSIINIEGEEYIVLKNTTKNNYLILKKKRIKVENFDSKSNLYENSNVDVYLNEEYYNSLSFKKAIIKTSIQQDMYKRDNDFTTFTRINKSDCIQRKIFVPSLEEISYIINPYNKEEVRLFLKDDLGTFHMMLRDNFDDKDQILFLHSGGNTVYTGKYNSSFIRVRPAFIVDLSKVDFSVIY